MKTIEVDGVELSLPTEKNKASTSLQDASFLLYGEKKIGKTTLLTQFPDAFFLFTEPGGKFLETFNRLPQDWKQFKGYIRMLKKTSQYRTIIIDTVDNAYKMCYAQVCRDIGIEHPQEDDKHAGWTRISNEFAEQINLILSLGRGVVFTSHCEEKEEETRDGQTVRRIVPTMSKQARRILEPIVDVWACYKYRGDDRVLYIQGSDTLSAGHRLENNFVGVGKYIPMGKSKEEAYANLITAFNQTTGSAAPKPKVQVRVITK